MLSNKMLFFWILAFSAIISCALFVGRIDPDFYSWYYIGRGVAHGANMYRDFSENKGPVLYLFFTLLYSLFRDHYKVGLVISSTVLDAISIYFLFQIAKDAYGLIARKTYKTFLITLAAVLVYKGFLISSFQGSIYSESIGIAYFIPSYWLYRTNRNFYAGVLFAAAVLTRQTLLFFLPVFLITTLLDGSNRRKLIPFFVGFLTICAVFTTYFVLTGSFHDFIYSTYIVNLHYAKAVQKQAIKSVVDSFRSTPSIMFILVSATLLLVWILFTAKTKEKYLLFVSFLCSLASIYPGGFFYPHHFVQFMPIIFLIIAFAVSRLARIIYQPILTVMAIFIIPLTLLNYGLFLFKSPQAKLPAAYDVGTKKYAVVLTYHPEYYTLYHVDAPDRYYETVFLLPTYNTKWWIDAARHSQLSKEKLQQTAFLAIINSASDQQDADNYLQEFGNIFQLKKISSRTQDGTLMELYTSNF